MAYKVGGLFVSLAAGSARFAQDMKKARDTAKSSSAGMKNSFAAVSKSGLTLTNSLRAIRTAAIAAAGPAALGALIKKSIDYADQTAKTADKIGISTDALQEYRFAASLAGVDTKALDMGMQRFNRRVAEVAQGTGELKSTLDAYGIAVRDAEGRSRSSEDVLNDLADTIMNAESQQEQLRIAFKAFDSEGAAIVNMLKRGSAGLDEYRQKARQAGIVIEENLLRGAEDAKDALTLLHRTVSANLTRAVITLAPQITDLANRFTEGLPGLFAWVQKFMEWTGLIEASSLSTLEGQLGDVNSQIATLETKMVDLQDAKFMKETRIQAVQMKLEILYEQQRKLEQGVEGVKQANADAHAARKQQIQEEIDIQTQNLQAINEEKQAQKEKERLLKEFGNLHAEMTTGQFELQRQKLDEHIEQWREAGADITEIERVAAEKRKQIAEDEFAYKAQKFQETVNAVAGFANAVVDLEKAKIQKNLADEEQAAQDRFDIRKSGIEAQNTEAGKLTEKGQALLADLEEDHLNHLQKVRDDAARNEKKAAKKLKPVKVAQVISNTAVEASKVLANPIALAAVLAAGAIQLATVKAQPYGKGAVIQAPTFFRTPDGPGVMSERPGKMEGILPLVRAPGGDLGVKAVGESGSSQTVLNLSISFEGITPEEDLQRRVIPGIEDAVRRGVSKLQVRGG